MKTYFQQLQRVHKNVLRKHPALVNKRNVVLLNDNLRQHLSRKKYCVQASLFYNIHHIHKILYQVISHFWFSAKCSGRQKISQKDPMKIFLENFLGLKTATFYLWRIYKPNDKWQEGVQNNSENTIDWNQLIAKLFIKTKIIYDSI